MNDPNNDDTIKADCGHWESESRITIRRFYDTHAGMWVDQVICAACDIELADVPRSEVQV